jgi:hypothetical protein
VACSCCRCAWRRRRSVGRTAVHACCCCCCCLAAAGVMCLHVAQRRTRAARPAPCSVRRRASANGLVHVGGGRGRACLLPAPHPAAGRRALPLAGSGHDGRRAAAAGDLRGTGV